MKLSQILSEDLGQQSTFTNPSDKFILKNPAAVDYGDEDELGQQHPVSKPAAPSQQTAVPASIQDVAKRVGALFQGKVFQPTRPELNDQAKEMIKLIAQQATSIKEVPDMSGNQGRTVTEYILPDCKVTTWNIGTPQLDGDGTYTRAMKTNPYFYFMCIRWDPL